MMDSMLFEAGADIATCRVTGEHTLEEGVALVTAAILRSRELGIGKLLVDVTTVTGFGPPSLAARHWFMGEWAKAARAHVRLAMVVRSEFLDPDRFCVIRAANLGLAYNLFDNEQRAFAWLHV